MSKVFKILGYFVFNLILFGLVSQADAQNQVNGLADTPWPMYQHDPQHTGRSPFQGPIQKPELLWTAELPQCWGESGGISIAPDGSLLTSIGGCLANFDPATRGRRWTYQNGGNSRSVTLVSGDQTIYWGFGMTYGQLSASGGTIWLADLDPNLVFGSSSTFGNDGNLYFVHDGVWSFTPDGANRWFLPFDWFAHTSPAIGLDGNIYAGTNIGAEDICAYTPSGGIDWCEDIPGTAYDRTVSVGQDGTIYVPTQGISEPYSDSGIVALDPSGSIKWHFHSAEGDIYSVLDGIAIGPDGAIYYGFGLEHTPDSYLYSISSSGQFNWKAHFSGNALTGIGPNIHVPITVDRTGNAYMCLMNSRCYGISSHGTIMWEYEFPLIDSIVIASSTQPIIAQDGLFYLVDNQSRLYAFADPSQYSIIKTSTKKIELSAELDGPAFTTTIPITSSALSTSFIVSINPPVSWLSLDQQEFTTPTQVDIHVYPYLLPAGNYQSSIMIKPSDVLQSEITIPINLLVGELQYFVPMAFNISQSNDILFFSDWFSEYQFASIDLSNSKRKVISLNLPTQIDAVAYSADGHKVALVPYYSGGHQISIMDTETGATILEISHPANISYPAWSPDSNRITFISYNDDMYNGEVYVINLDGTGLTRLTNNNLRETEMVWSPDGNKIAVQVNYSWIYIMNTDGSDFHQLVTGHRMDLIQGWSRNGRNLVLGTRLNDELDPLLLGIYEIETGIYSILADNLVSDARISPDGSSIAYVGHEADAVDDWDIFMIGADGSNLINLTHGLDNEDSQPSWSPNNQWLVFSSRSDETYEDPNYDLYIIKIDGTGLSQVTRNIQADYYPSWKP